MNVVVDSSCLLYLGKLGLLKKVGQLPGKKIIPSNVYAEVVTKGVERQEPETEEIETLIRKKVFVVKVATSTIFTGNPFLSAADREVLALAKEESAIAIIDEMYARDIAAAAGIKVHGTVFLLLTISSKGLLTKQQTKEALDRLLVLGFYLSADIYRETTKKIERMK